MAREEKGISLDQLQSMTKIQKKYLVGIEKGDYSQIPGKFYVRAFIKQYAEAVGIESDELFEEYKSEIPVTREEDISGQLSRVQSRRPVSNAGSKAMELMPKIVIGIVIVLVLFLIWYFITKDSNEEGTVSQSENPAVDVEQSNDIAPSKEKGKNDEGNSGDTKKGNDKKDKAESDSNEEKLQPGNVTGNTTTYTLSGTDEFEVEVKASEQGETWVKIGSPDEVLFQGMLQNGDSQKFDLSGKAEVNIRTGKAPDTEISVNGNPLVYELEPNQNVTQNIKIKHSKE